MRNDRKCEIYQISTQCQPAICARLIGGGGISWRAQFSRRVIGLNPPTLHLVRLQLSTGGVKISRKLSACGTEDGGMRTRKTNPRRTRQLMGK